MGEKIEFIKDRVIHPEVLKKVVCKCGHSVLSHYFCEGCCDRSGCGCPKFEQHFELTQDRIGGE